MDDVGVTLSHSHQVDCFGAEAEEERCSVRQKPKTSRESTTSILATAIKETVEPVRAHPGREVYQNK